MFKSSFFQFVPFFGNQSNQKGNTSIKTPNIPNPKIDKTKVISMNTINETDDFVEVDIKNLSYAEVAALSRKNPQKVIAGGKHVKGQTSDSKIVDEYDLEREVTDYQMSKVLSEHVSRKQQGFDVGVGADVISGKHEIEEALDDAQCYNDKSHRRSKKAKFLKKGK